MILTLGLDGETEATLNALRRRHFPPERNHLRAHVTMFHALADDPAVLDLVDADSFPVRVGPPRSLGRGVALAVDAPEAHALRATWAHLAVTPQDRQPWRPHVTVQNKVTPELARQTLQVLEGTSYTGRAVSVRAWAYLGGPWELLREEPLRD